MTSPTTGPTSAALFHGSNQIAGGSTSVESSQTTVSTVAFQWIGAQHPNSPATKLAPDISAHRVAVDEHSAKTFLSQTLPTDLTQSGSLTGSCVLVMHPSPRDVADMPLIGVPLKLNEPHLLTDVELAFLRSSERGVKVCPFAKKGDINHLLPTAPFPNLLASLVSFDKRQNISNRKAYEEHFLPGAISDLRRFKTTFSFQLNGKHVQMPEFPTGNVSVEQAKQFLNEIFSADENLTEDQKLLISLFFNQGTLSVSKTIRDDIAKNSEDPVIIEDSTGIKTNLFVDRSENGLVISLDYSQPYKVFDSDVELDPTKPANTFTNFRGVWKVGPIMDFDSEDMFDDATEYYYSVGISNNPPQELDDFKENPPPSPSSSSAASSTATSNSASNKSWWQTLWPTLWPF